MATSGASFSLTVENLVTQLQQHFMKVFYQKGELRPIFLLIDQLVTNHGQLRKAVAENLVQGVLKPYGARTLEHNSQVLAMKMVKLMSWWLREKPLGISSTDVLEIIRERQIIISSNQANGSIVEKYV